MNDMDVSGGKGGIGIAGDDQFLYFGYYEVLRRYSPNGEPGRWTARDGKPEWGIHLSRPRAATATSGAWRWIRPRHRLFVAVGPDGDGKNSPDVVHIYDTADLNVPPVVVPVPQPREVAASGDGTFWVVSSAAHPPSARHLGGSGASPTHSAFSGTTATRLPQNITGGPGFFPTALCFDAKQRLLVADNGPDQDIKIYGAAALDAGPSPAGRHVRRERRRPGRDRRGGRAAGRRPAARPAFTACAAWAWMRRATFMSRRARSAPTGTSSKAAACWNADPGGQTLMAGAEPGVRGRRGG